MCALRFLFAPELTRSLTDAARSLAVLLQRMRPFRLPVPANAPSNGAHETRRDDPAPNAPKANSPRLSRKKRALSCTGLLVLLAGAAFIVIGIAGLLAETAVAQTIDRGLFADADRATREVLAFLGDTGAGRSSVLGDMLFVFNGGVLALAGFLLVWHTVAGTLDTAREGRFGFGAWEIVRIVAAVALMAPLPGGMNGAQHAVIGLAHLGGDFANAVWEPFSEETLGEGEPIAPRPRETVWRAAIARTLILETCRYAANGSAARAGDAPYIELRESDEAYKSPGITRVRRIAARILHYDGAGRGMPGDLCGAIRFAGLAAEGARGIAAEGHRDALAGLLPEIRGIAADLAAHYVTGSTVYGRPLPDLDALLVGRGLAERYAGVLDTALVRAASEERAELVRVVAEDARAASWMSAASFFNTIAHRTGLFQAAAHNIPGVSLPPPSLEQWAAAGSGLLESVPFVGKGLDMFESVWQVADGFVSTVLGLLLVAGAVLAYLLPALPFIRFLFAILGWIVTVVVAVLAVTVFAAAHVTRGDGNRLATQATRLGWLFLPGLILRPPLMLFGLIAGYFVFLAGIGLFNEVWLPQMRDAGASGGLGPIGFLAMLTLYVMIAYGLMNASFKLIDLLPSAVLDWIGGRSGAGEDGGERVGGAAAGAISRVGGLRRLQTMMEF